MRDVLRLTETVKIVTTNTFGGTSTNSYTNVLTDKARADSVETSPNQAGIFVDPTNYSGYFYFGSGEPVDFSFVSPTLGTIMKVKGDSPANLLSTVQWETYGVNTITHTPNINTWLQSATASKIQRKINDGEWDLGQDLAEARETLEFLATPVRLLVKLIKAIYQTPRSVFNVVRLISSVGFGDVHEAALLQRYLKRNKRKLLRASAKSTASLFLAYKFAWLPLMQSIHDAVEAIKSRFNSGFCYSKARTETEELKPPPDRAGTWVFERYWRVKQGCQTEVKCVVSSSFLYGLNLLGLTNPAKIVWELMPLSFVLDWFIPIGNFISALQGPMGLSFKSGYQTSYIKWSYEALFVPSTMVNGAKGRFMRYRGRQFAFRRDLLIGFPIPVPYFRGMETALSGDKMISMMAIAVQRAK